MIIEIGRTGELFHYKTVEKPPMYKGTILVHAIIVRGGFYDNELVKVNYLDAEKQDITLAILLQRRPRTDGENGTEFYGHIPNAVMSAAGRKFANVTIMAPQGDGYKTITSKEIPFEVYESGETVDFEPLPEELATELTRKITDYEPRLAAQEAATEAQAAWNEAIEGNITANFATVTENKADADAKIKALADADVEIQATAERNRVGAIESLNATKTELVTMISAKTAIERSDGSGTFERVRLGSEIVGQTPGGSIRGGTGAGTDDYGGNVAIGSNATAIGDGVAIGSGARATASRTTSCDGVAIGKDAHTAAPCVQLGKGDNAEAGTLQVYGHKVMNADGSLPEVTKHNAAADAHADIRGEIDTIKTALEADDAALDTFREIGAYIKENRTLLEGVTISKVNKTDIVDNLTTNDATKPLSARQGNVLNSEINRSKADLSHFRDSYDARVLEVNVALSQKSNAADVYTKAQVDAKIAEGGGGSGGGTITAEREDILAESTREDAAFSYDGTAWKFTFPLKFRELPKSGDKLTFELEYDKGGGNETVTACAVVRNVMNMTIFATDVANGAPTVYCDANYALGELAMLPEYEIKAWNQKTGTEMSGGWQYPVEDIKYRAYRLIGDSASQIMNIDVDKIEAFMRANIGKFLMGSEEITESSIEAFMSEIRQQGYGNVCVLHQSFGSNPPRYRENETVSKPRAALIYEVEKGYSTTESPINEYLKLKHIWRN